MDSPCHLDQETLALKIDLPWAAILLLGLWARLWGVTHGLPLRYEHIDESVVIFYSMRFFTGDLNPHIFFDYPTLFLYILFASLSAIYGALHIFFKTSLEKFLELFYFGDVTPFYLTARGLSLLFSIGSILLIFQISRKLTDRATALWAMAFLAICLPSALYAHYGTVDSAAQFFFLLAVAASLPLAKSASPRSCLWAGLACGLAGAAKYYGAIQILPAAWLILKNRFLPAGGRSAFGGKKWRSLALLFGGAGLGFFIGCPFAFLDFKSFLARFTDRFSLFISPGPPQGWHHLEYIFTLGKNWDWILLILSGIGMAWAARRTISERYLLLSVAVLFGFIGIWKSANARYLLPLYPLLCLFAACGWRGLRLASPHILRGAMGTLLGFILLIPSGWRILKMNHSFTQKDTRLLSAEWTRRNLSSGARILCGPFTPEFPKDSFRVVRDWEDRHKRWPEKKLLREFDWAVTSSLHRDPPEFEQFLARRGILITKFSAASYGEFHNPAIRLWKIQ